MAKKQNKAVKEETLETILFNCRNSLRGRAAMTDKRDLLLTLVFLKFIYGHEIEMYTVEQGEKRDKRQ